MTVDRNTVKSVVIGTTALLVVVVAILAVLQPFPGLPRSKLEQAWLTRAILSLLEAQVDPSGLSVDAVDRIVSGDSISGVGLTRAIEHKCNGASGVFASIVIGRDRSSSQLVVVGRLHRDDTVVVYTKAPGDWQPPIYDREEIGDWDSALDRLSVTTNVFDLLREGDR